MDVYNEKLLGGGIAASQERMKMHWDIKPEAAAKCIKCGKCEKLCTQHIPIMERLDEISHM